MVNVYEVLKNCGSDIVVCGYNGSVVDVYGGKLKKGECGFREKRGVKG